MASNEPVSITQRIAQRKATLPAALSEEQIRRRSVTRVRYMLSTIAEELGQEIPALLEELRWQDDGAEKVLNMYIKLLEFSVPKLSRAEVKVEAPGDGATANLTMEQLQDIIREGVRLESRTIDGESKRVETPTD